MAMEGVGARPLGMVMEASLKANLGSHLRHLLPHAASETRKGNRRCGLVVSVLSRESRLPARPVWVRASDAQSVWVVLYTCVFLNNNNTTG